MEIPHLIKENEQYTFTIKQEWTGSRLDKFLSAMFTQYSRSFFQQLIASKSVCINNLECKKTGVILREKDIVTISFPKKITPEQIISEHIDLKVRLIYEHEQFLILHKPAGLIVHSPHRLSNEVTLVDWIVTHYNSIKSIGCIDRPGIVHRLDKETSGLMIIPRTNHAHGIFSAMFHDRDIKKTYLAIVEGNPPQSGSIDYFIGRDPTCKTRMRAFKNPTQFLNVKKRDALTSYTVLSNFKDHCLIEAHPATGRTHQIRVHLAAIGHPLLGDSVYGKTSKHIIRHALHAHKISFVFEGELFFFTADLPEDLAAALIAIDSK